MKSITLLLSLASMSVASICGSLTLTTQLDIDTQAANCTVVNGDLEIGSNFTDYFRVDVVAITGNLIGRDLNSLTLVSIPELTAVGGNVELSGGFYSVSLPSLKSVDGDFSIVSSEEIYCSNFDGLVGGGVRGKFECREGGI